MIMIFIKYIILIFILLLSSYIGLLISRKYLNRVNELKEMKHMLNIFETKIKYTYQPIPQIFKEISNNNNNPINDIFLNSANYMDKLNAGDAWNKALDNIETSLNKEDINILKGLSSLLGRVDIDGQISEIELINSFLDNQIEIASREKQKYSKLYKTLGITIGLTIVIILI